ncbi:uncharacterized protein LOC132611830 [Lycium barbarum]|uniref:uncharacterized protein LOC132611830 n=1 Tax=Lycium barbarum TaxID=112863 RepID=UPI00293F64DD|nr:uncharacterized protein LOC132611830 [Lycium barbarum]
MDDATPNVQSRNVDKTITYDNSHPYHLNNSDSPGMALINNVFDGKGYPGWRISILLALSAKRKLGFINGACKAPDLKSEEYEQWSCVNDMIICWISNALTKEIADSVMSSKTAKELWDSLEQRFGKSNGAKLYHLQKELSGLVQGNNDIARYFTKLKRIWDELDALDVVICCLCVCVCQGKAKLMKSLEDQRLIQFLMGLNDIYTQARGNILMMNPLPIMDLAYSLLLQDENQREAYVNASHTTESASFMVTSQGRNYQRNENQNFKASNQPQQRFGNYTPRNNKNFSKYKPRKNKYNPNVSCTYCGRTSHTEDDCHRLYGFPEDFEFTKAKP